MKLHLSQVPPQTTPTGTMTRNGRSADGRTRDRRRLALGGTPGRRRSVRQLLAGGPLLVALTPAGDRPWISGTSDNNILSLILAYNGLGRIAGQSGGPGGIAGGSTMFGGPTGAFRLLQSGLGDQAGWLLGFALVSGLGVLATTACAVATHVQAG
jgi:hypothetical protein